MERPIITYQKWWHRFSPKHRKMIYWADKMFEHQWNSGLKEEHEREMKNLLLHGKNSYGQYVEPAVSHKYGNLPNN